MNANLIFDTGRNLGAKVSHWTNKVASYESRLSNEVEDTCTTEEVIGDPKPNACLDRRFGIGFGGEKSCNVLARYPISGSCKCINT